MLFCVPPRLKSLCLVVAALFSVSLPLAAAQSEDSTELFNGQDLVDWDSWLGATEVPKIPFKLWGDWPALIGLNQDDTGVFSVVEEDGEPAIRISGEIWGALISREEYANYHLQLQYKWGEQRFPPRHEKPRNTGLLYHSTGDYGAFWSYWMRSVEFEIMEGHTGDFTSVDSVKVEVATVFDRDAPFPWRRHSDQGDLETAGGIVFRVSAERDWEYPLGQWNTLDLFVVGGRSIHVVNGSAVMRLENLRHKVNGKIVPLKKGKIQLQSEGAEVYFRHIRIRPIESLPPMT